MLNNRLNRTPITGTTRAAVFAVLLAMTVAVAAAQSAYFSFSGTVADESSRGVPGTTLVLANEQRQMKYEVKSNEAGRFEFVGLPAGEYGLLVRGLGFQDVKDVDHYYRAEPAAERRAQVGDAPGNNHRQLRSC